MANEDASLDGFLERLLNVVEVVSREGRSQQVSTKLATLPTVKTLEQHDFGLAAGALLSVVI